MRMIFSLIGLLIVLAIVGFLAKSQLSAVTQLPNSGALNATTSAMPSSTAHQHQQMQKQATEQVKEQLDAAMQAAAAARLKLEAAESK